MYYDEFCGVYYFLLLINYSLRKGYFKLFDSLKFLVPYRPDWYIIGLYVCDGIFLSALRFKIYWINNWKNFDIYYNNIHSQNRIHSLFLL